MKPRPPSPQVVDLGLDVRRTFARKDKALVAAPWLTLLDHATRPYGFRPEGHGRFGPRTPEEFAGHLGHHRAAFAGSDADHPLAPAVKLYEEHANALLGHADVVDWSELKWGGKLNK